MDYITLTYDPLKVEEIYKLVENNTCGAISFFVGTTRNSFEGKKVKSLEYDSYNSMAETELKKICNNARQKWELHHIAIHHRLGLVKIKEASVVIAVSSVHRRESLEAVSFIIDSLKSSVPIWKKELYEGGESSWKRNKECFWTGESSSSEAYSEVPPLKKCRKDENLFSSENYNVPNIKDCFIQISASKEEVDRRINAFQQMKREELNILNIQEFCSRDLDDENSCARTSTVVLKAKGSSSHLKLTKINNAWGPQTDGIDPGSLDIDTIKSEPEDERSKTTNFPPKSSHPQEVDHRMIPPALEERLQNMESHLKVSFLGPVPPSVYSRLRQLEDRILCLESSSPEYFNTDQKVSRRNFPKSETVGQSSVSFGDIDARMLALKKKLKEKQIK